MKTIAIISCFLFISNSLFSQKDSAENKAKTDIQTFFGKIRNSDVYGAITFKYSYINQISNFDIGGRAGWIVDRKIGLGIGGYAFFREPQYDKTYNEKFSLKGGYGGVFIEPIVFPYFPVHITIPVLLGIGGVSYTSTDQSNSWYYQYNSDYPSETQFFILAEPGLEVEFCLKKHLSFCIGSYYRYTSSLSITNNSPQVLNGLSFAITLKIGKI